MKKNMSTAEQNNKVKITQIPPNKTISIGCRIECLGTKYILAQVGYNKITAINLETGNRIDEPCLVFNCTRINLRELKNILGTRNVMFWDFNLNDFKD